MSARKEDVMNITTVEMNNMVIKANQRRTEATKALLGNMLDKIVLPSESDLKAALSGGEHA